MKLIFPSNSCSSFRVSFASICCYITTSHSIRTQKSKWPCRDKYSALQQLISMVFSSLHRIMSFLLKKFNSEATTVRAARSPANNQYSIQRGTRGGGEQPKGKEKKLNKKNNNLDPMIGPWSSTLHRMSELLVEKLQDWSNNTSSKKN